MSGEPTPAPSAHRVLVVGDSATMRKVISTVLMTKGCVPSQAHNGEVARGIARTVSPDLILLDLEMPVLDGFSTLKRLKADPTTRTIPVIVVTGLSDRESRPRALDEGADDCLAKPFDPTELWIRVRNHLQLKEYADRLTNLNRNLERTVAVRTAELQHSYRESVFLLTGAAERRDENTGARILGFASTPYVRMGAEIALTHHECWDGSGYPNGWRANRFPSPAACSSCATVRCAAQRATIQDAARSHDGRTDHHARRRAHSAGAVQPGCAFGVSPLPTRIRSDTC